MKNINDYSKLEKKAKVKSTIGNVFKYLLLTLAFFSSLE